jgi:serine phosphatase RsbU (regulator of sigma subunit)/anti-sigma regulatory factor (Ser/Thr protein kinase)
MAHHQHKKSAPERSRKSLSKEVEELRANVRHLNERLAEAKNTITYLSERLQAQTATSPVLEEAKAEQDSEDLRALAKQLERQSMILARDKAVARKLQESVRPLWLTDFAGVEFDAHSRTGSRVGGDFYDVIKLSDTTIGVLIADVSGYGLPAAVIMATARMAFRTFATTESSPKAILDKSNEALLESTLAGHHLTAFLGLLDSEMLTFQYVNASHCPPYLVRDGEVQPLDTDGLFVGMFDEPRYEQKSIQLERGDKLVLFTDGLIRMFDAGSKEEALANLQENLRQNSSLPVRDLLHKVSDHIVEEPEDDVLILTMELLRRRARRKTISISSIPSEVGRVEDTILPSLSARGYGERALFAVKLALEEAIINAIKHGNQLDTTKKVNVDFTIEEDRVEIAVADEGEGFDPEAVPDPRKEENIEAHSGRGLLLMRAYMDSVQFNEKGNRVTMVKYAPWYSATPAEQTSQ